MNSKPLSRQQILLAAAAAGVTPATIVRALTEGIAPHYKSKARARALAAIAALGFGTSTPAPLAISSLAEVKFS